MFAFLLFFVQCVRGPCVAAKGGLARGCVLKLKGKGTVEAKGKRVKIFILFLKKKKIELRGGRIKKLIVFTLDPGYSMCTVGRVMQNECSCARERIPLRGFCYGSLLAS